MCIRVVRPADAEFIQRPVIVRSESFKEVVHEWLAGVGSPCELMPVKVIDASWDEDIAEDVEGRGQALNEIIEQVVIRVCAVMKQGAEGCLPLLGLENAVGVR